MQNLFLLVAHFVQHLPDCELKHFCPSFCHFQDVIGIQGLVLSWYADPLRILLSSLARWILRLGALCTSFVLRVV
jgi:hypothetical protein